MLGRRGERADETVPETDIASNDEHLAPTEGQEAANPVDAPADAQAEPRDVEETEPQEELAGPGEDLVDPEERLAQELESVTDRHLRLAAEFENFRKRTRREQADLSVVAQADLARRLLPTLDDLARVSSIPPETTTVEALDQGLDLILRNLRKELEEAGLARIEAQGERFNPEQHQALMTADTADRDLADTVSRVFVDGYMFRGRLVRPAQVEVLNYAPEVAEDE